MSDGPAIARATFTPIAPGGKPFPVHFNPTSLQYQVTNSLKEEGNGKDKKQFITQSTAKLTLDLIFDTTLSGESVRTVTEKLVAFMQPAVGTATGGGKKAAAVVEFRWGGYAFKGMVESYKETLDFFSASGVPLRATVNLGLVQQDRTFETRRTAVQGRLQATPEPVVVPAPGGRPPGLTGGGGQDATLLAARAGDARAGRAIAAANGEASMRFASGEALTVSASVVLGSPVAFASGGLGLGAGARGDGIGASLSAGGRGSAGVAASAGAFGGLRAPAPAGIALDAERLVARAETVALSVDEAASFDLGGQVSAEGSASLGADVGTSASLRNRIQFEED